MPGSKPKAIQVQHKASCQWHCARVRCSFMAAVESWHSLLPPFMAASAAVWLLGIIIDTLASLPLPLSLALSFSFSHSQIRAVSMQPLKLHALALAIIKLRHPSRWGSRQHNCKLQLPGQLPRGKIEQSSRTSDVGN